ncbi:MAG: hypothetical protein ACRDZZ_03670 [Ilumatobacteraceae bacterium]
MTHLWCAARITVAATVATLVPTALWPERADAGPITSRFEATPSPCRVADTRNGSGFAAIGPDRIRVAMTGRCGIPDGATAVAVTVTATQAESAGFLTAWPAGQALPNVSTVNYEAFEDRANGAIVRLGAGGAIDIMAAAPAHIVVDVTGWFVPAEQAVSGRYVPIAARRVFDSRWTSFSRPVLAGESINLAAPAGIPADAIALAINVTTTSPNEPGFFTAHPAGSPLPEASLLNTDRGDQTRAAASITPVSEGGLTIYSHSGGHLIVDVTGWFTGPSAFESTEGLFVAADSPRRLVDTRGGDPIWPGGAIRVPVPVTDASSIVANVTLVGAHAWGFLTAYAAGTAVPEASTVNADAKGRTAANLAIVPVSTAGIDVSSYGGADVVVDLAGWFVGTPSIPTTHETPANVRPPVCVADTSAGSLTAFFATGDPILGADYQRAYPLADGRTLWMFQDVFVRSRAGSTFVHNAGLIQTGNCFTLLQSGDYARPGNYVLDGATTPLRHWYWALGGDMGADGTFQLFFAEMIERGPKYLSFTEPVATWRVSIDLTDMSVAAFAPAADNSGALYGWSVTSDASYSYLYAHCYRQFGWDPLLYLDPPLYTHDFDCTANVTVARVPRGHLEAAPQYWDGSSWTSDAHRAVPVIPRGDRLVNPTQVMFDGYQFVAVTKEGDWWGDTIYLDVAPAAEGPWITYATIDVPSECSICNTYFASFVPWRAADGALIVGLSRNTFEGVFTGLYSPRFLTAPGP